jgi:hypothetical protein
MAVEKILYGALKSRKEPITRFHAPITRFEHVPSLRAMRRRDLLARTIAPSLTRKCRLIRPPVASAAIKGEKASKKGKKGSAFIKALRTLNRSSIALMSVPIMKTEKMLCFVFPGLQRFC